MLTARTGNDGWMNPNERAKPQGCTRTYNDDNKIVSYCCDHLTYIVDNRDNLLERPLQRIFYAHEPAQRGAEVKLTHAAAYTMSRHTSVFEIWRSGYISLHPLTSSAPQAP